MESLTYFLWSVLLLLLIDKQNTTKQNLAHLIHCGPFLHFLCQQKFSIVTLCTVVYSFPIFVSYLKMSENLKIVDPVNFLSFFCEQFNNLFVCLWMVRYKFIAWQSNLSLNVTTASNLFEVTLHLSSHQWDKLWYWYIVLLWSPAFLQ